MLAIRTMDPAALLSAAGASVAEPLQNPDNASQSQSQSRLQLLPQMVTTKRQPAISFNQANIQQNYKNGMSSTGGAVGSGIPGIAGADAASPAPHPAPTINVTDSYFTFKNNSNNISSNNMDNDTSKSEFDTTVTPAFQMPKQSRLPSFQMPPQDYPDEYYYDTEDLDIYRLFVQPKYLKINSGSKFRTSLFKRLFLAQELDTTKRSVSNIKPTISNLSSSVFSSNTSHFDNTSTAQSSTASSSAAAADNNTKKKKNVVANRDNAIWCLKFSHDGKYLAAGGKDSVIRVYKVISSPLDRLEYEHNKANADLARVSVGGSGIGNGNGGADIGSLADSTSDAGRSYNNEFDASNGFDGTSNYNGTNTGQSMYRNISNGATTAAADSGTLYAPLFHDAPYKEFHGHSSDILSLDWSKNNFLLSSSMDRTVRLWHVERAESLQVFKHLDFVTCAMFHPHDDRFFISGSLDKKIRLWSILDGEVSFHQEVASMITACEFFPKGDCIAVGTINGLVFIFETKGLHLKYHLDLRKNYIKNSSGAKVSGLQVFEMEPEKNGFIDTRILITTNDSRVRLYSCAKKKLLMKFKGLQNTSSQAMAVSSSDHALVLSASEDHLIYLWHVNDKEVLNKSKKKGKGINSIFKKAAAATTASSSSFSSNGGSNNGSNSKRSRVKLGDDDLPENIKNANYHSFHAHHSAVTSAIFVPNRAKKLLYLSNDPVYDLNRTFGEILEHSSEQEKQEGLKNVNNLLKRVLSNSSLSSNSSQEDLGRLHTSPSSTATDFNTENATSFLNSGSNNSDKHFNLLRSLKNKNEVDLMISLLDPLAFQIVVSADESGKIRIFRIDSAYQIRKIIQEELIPNANNSSNGKKSHHHHNDSHVSKLNLDPFFKKLSNHEHYLVSQRLNTLTLDENGMITNTAKPLRNKHLYHHPLPLLRLKRKNTTSTTGRKYTLGSNNGGPFTPTTDLPSPGATGAYRFGGVNLSAQNSPFGSPMKATTGDLTVPVEDERRFPTLSGSVSALNLQNLQNNSNHNNQNNNYTNNYTNNYNYNGHHNNHNNSYFDGTTLSTGTLSYNNNNNTNNSHLRVTQNNNNSHSMNNVSTGSSKTLKDLIVDQNDAIHSDLKQDALNMVAATGAPPSAQLPLEGTSQAAGSLGSKKNSRKTASFYTLSNGSASLSSLLRGRSELASSAAVGGAEGSHAKNGSNETNGGNGNTYNGRHACEVCQGTKFCAKKVQYKNGSMVAKICQDCGNQVNA